jgi:hypothetical protein
MPTTNDGTGRNISYAGSTMNGSYSVQLANVNQEAKKISHLLERNILTRNESSQNSQKQKQRKRDIFHHNGDPT